MSKGSRPRRKSGAERRGKPSSGGKPSVNGKPSSGGKPSGGGKPSADGKHRADGKPNPVGPTRKSRLPALGEHAADASAPSPTLSSEGNRVFRLGVIPGATAGTWIDRWRERMPEVELQLVPLTLATQRRALDADEVDAALVRLPFDRDGLHVIALYDEVPVVVFAAESHLDAADELDLSDLAGEVRIVATDDPLASLIVPGTAAAAFDPPETTGDAIAVIGAGVGIAILPMSLARLHQRRDVGHRPLRDGPLSTVALAWPAEGTTADVEMFVGIVRGRTSNSSRS